MNDADRGRLVSEPVLQCAFDFWRNVDADLGNRIEKGLRSG
jgi:catalase